MQEFIVYRNPLEAQLWGYWANGGLFPILVAMFVAVAVIVGCCALVDMYVPRDKRKFWTDMALVAGAVAAALVLYVM